MGKKADTLKPTATMQNPVERVVRSLLIDVPPRLMGYNVGHIRQNSAQCALKLHSEMRVKSHSRKP
jgi:hypothetical protein